MIPTAMKNNANPTTRFMTSPGFASYSHYIHSSQIALLQNMFILFLPHLEYQLRPALSSFLLLDLLHGQSHLAPYQESW